MNNNRSFSFLQLLGIHGAYVHIFLSFSYNGLLLFQLANKLLKIPNQISIMLNIMGPVCGFLIQPIVSVYSDNSKSSFGRRRPYILIGMIFMTLSLILFSLTVYINTIKNSYAVIVCFIAQLLFMIALNIVLAPFRALIQDIVPEEQLDYANSISSFSTGIAYVVFGTIVYLYARLSKISLDSFFVWTTVGLIIISPFMTACTMFFAHEKRNTSFQSSFKDLLNSFKHFPLPSLIIPFLFSWASLYPYVAFVTSPASLDILNGSLAQVISNLSCLIFSFLIPIITKKNSEKWIWLPTQILTTVSCGIMSFMKVDLIIILITATMIGMNMSSMYAIPYAIIGKYCVKKEEMDKIGVYCSIINCGCVVGQMVGLISQMILFRLYEGSERRISFILSSVYGGLATIGLLWMKLI